MIIRSGLLLLVFGLAACHSTGEKQKSPSMSTPANHTVIIQQMKFVPATLSVHAGDTITWVNRDMVYHNVTETGQNGWTSGLMPVGATWKISVARSVAYVCTIHPGMAGNITVR